MPVGLPIRYPSQQAMTGLPEARSIVVAADAQLTLRIRASASACSITMSLLAMSVEKLLEEVMPANPLSLFIA
jgi:hypothetical protein